MTALLPERPAAHEAGALSAVRARQGVDLLRWQTSSDLTRLKRSTEPDGSTILRGVQVLKVGTFNGLDVTAGDLQAMAERFSSLRETVGFEPPVRLDHSMSVLSIVGWHEGLYTATGPDRETGEDTTYLLADWRITEPDVMPKIQRGTLRFRSSELGPYRTNAGVDMPLVYYGVAFVDIPAVEGLAAIRLSARQQPRSILTVTDRSTDVTDLAVEQDMTSDAETADVVGAPDVAATPEPAPVTASVAVDDEPDVEGPDGAAVERELPTDAGPNPELSLREVVSQIEVRPRLVEDEMERLRAELAAARAEAAGAELSRHEARGVVTLQNRQAAQTLLTHVDPGVREAARTLLVSAHPPVALRQNLGRQASLQDARPTGVSAFGLDAAMSKDEFVAAWGDLSTEQRMSTEGQRLYTAWQRAQRAT